MLVDDAVGRLVLWFESLRNLPWAKRARSGSRLEVDTHGRSLVYFLVKNVSCRRLSCFVLLLYLLDQVGDLLDDWRFADLLCILLLLHLLCFLALGAHIGVMAIELAVEAHDSFVLRVVFFVGCKELVKLFWVARLLLAVRGLVADDPASVAPDSLLLLLLVLLRAGALSDRVIGVAGNGVCDLHRRQLMSSARCRCPVLVVGTSMRLVDPVHSGWEIGEFRQTQLSIDAFDEGFDVLVPAVRPQWTEPEQVVHADITLHVAHRAVCTAELAEPHVVIGAIFLPPVARGCLMPVYALLALETVTFLLEVAADWNFVLFVDVQVFAVLASLALPFEPVDTDDLLVLRLIRLQAVRLVDSDQLVETHYIHLIPARSGRTTSNFRQSAEL